MASNVIAVITELLLGQWGVAPKVMLVGDVHTQPRLAFKAFVPRADHHPGELAPLPRTKARGGCGHQCRRASLPGRAARGLARGPCRFRRGDSLRPRDLLGNAPEREGPVDDAGHHYAEE